MRFIFEKLRDDKTKNWRKILKTLHLIDYLLKNGAPRVSQEIKSDEYLLKRKKEDYTCLEDGKDRGEAIRKSAAAIIDLINDDE